MSRARMIGLVITAVNVIAGTAVSVILQVATFPALGLTWVPVHALQAAGLLTLAALVRRACASFIGRGRNGSGAMSRGTPEQWPPGGRVDPCSSWGPGPAREPGYHAREIADRVSPAATLRKARVCGRIGVLGPWFYPMNSRQSRGWFAGSSPSADHPGGH